MSISGSPAEGQVRVGRLYFTAVSSTEEAVERILDSRAAGSEHFHLSNAYCIALAERDAGYRSVLNEGTIFADGRPVQWVSTLRKDAQRIRQVRGPGLFEAALRIGGDRERPTRHYLLGGSVSSLQLLERKIAQRFPNAVVCGAYSPPFRPLSSEEIWSQDKRIVDADPDVIWVGLGTPKQDYECKRLTAATGLPTVAIGAAFDFTAGAARVAPAWMTFVGLEWLFRLSREPRRLWKRYLVGNGVFVWSVLKSWGQR